MGARSASLHQASLRDSQSKSRSQPAFDRIRSPPKKTTASWTASRILSCSTALYSLQIRSLQNIPSASNMKQSYAPYVSMYFTTDALRGMYVDDVNPIPNPEDWCVPNDVKSRVVVYPNDPRQSGRPRISRIRSR